MVNVVAYAKTVWTIFRRRFNFRAHWCHRHCWVVLSYTLFSVVVWFACIPCKQLWQQSRQVVPSSAFPRTHSNSRGEEIWLNVLYRYYKPIEKYLKWKL
jgi:hypothetical protein